MAKAKTVFFCTECGAEAPRWMGQCPECRSWNTLTEAPAPVRRKGGAPGRAAPAARAVRIQAADDVEVTASEAVPTGIGELDRVLGGGVVPGSVVLIGGDPGIGKSTLLVQALARLADADRLAPLYVTGEESPEQVVLRARRLGLPTARLRLLAETGVDRILALAREDRPGVMVIDSIQTVFTDELQSAPGSVAQVRESAARLVRFAKESGTAVVLVGHVTKEGAIAGPRVLEHMVDTVLYFEAESNQRFRAVRAVKNRFGAANELGIFAMTETGLRPVANPSAIFLSRHERPVAGTAVTVTREGTRPLLLELQALVDVGAFSQPRRVAVGLDPNRLSMLLAVLHRHAGVAVQDQDVFVNVVGGVRVTETAPDLPLLLAVLSSLRDRPLPGDLVVFGEVGLAGEIRPVFNGEERLQQAAKHGFARAIVPRSNRPRTAPEGMTVVGVGRLAEAIEAL